MKFLAHCPVPGGKEFSSKIGCLSILVRSHLFRRLRLQEKLSSLPYMLPTQRYLGIFPLLSTPLGPAVPCLRQQGASNHGTRHRFDFD